ncbi:MAG: protease-like activity factor CPAF, partial [Chlamydiales bacterium]
MFTQSWPFKIILFSSLICVFYAQAAQPVNLVQSAMIQDLEVAKYNMSIKYAPFEWKKELFGWDLENAFQKAKSRILNENPRTSKDYQKIFNQFLGSTQDYHVQTLYYSTAMSIFPMQVKGINGRYYFTDIASNFSLESDHLAFFNINSDEFEEMIESFRGIQLGDEIIAIDDRPIREVIEELIDENFNGDRTPTGYALAERNLFLHRGKLGQEVPTGKFQITFLKEGNTQSFNRTFQWLHVPEWIPNHLLKGQFEKEAALTAAHLTNQNLSKDPIRTIDQLLGRDFSVAIAKEMTPPKLLSRIKEVRGAIRPLERSEEEDLREKGFLPPLGKILWESSKDKGIYAYLYRHPSKIKVGYLYLSSFNEVGEWAEEALNEIIAALKAFNRKGAEALVVDITDNIGGNMTYMYAVLSILTDRPLKVPYHRELLIQEDILKAVLIYNYLKDVDLDQYENDKSTGDPATLSGYPLTRKVIEQVLNYSSTIMQTWESGNRLTPPLYLIGIDEVMPHPRCRYKKPILLLTNEYNFSCADFFPAILQDNHRAKLFG